jgi:hypothetical protein
MTSLRRENEAFWNWLDEPASSRPSKRGDDAENALRWNVTTISDWSLISCQRQLGESR